MKHEIQIFLNDQSTQRQIELALNDIDRRALVAVVTLRTDRLNSLYALPLTIVVDARKVRFIHPRRSEQHDDIESAADCEQRCP